MLYKLIRYVFNTRPTKDFPFFMDKKDRKIWYCFHGDGIRYLTIYHRGRNLGNCKFLLEEDVLFLGDIFISERFPQYRNSGIGTKMFLLLIDYASEHNISRIEGHMQPEQKYLWPKLLKFYHSLGCTLDGGNFIYYLCENATR